MKLVAALLLAVCLHGTTAQKDTKPKNGAQAAQALLSSDVTRIGVGININLGDYSSTVNSLTQNGAKPITITRSVEFYNTGGDQHTLDVAYLAGLIYLAPGVTVKFTGLRVERGASAGPFGIFKGDASSTVVLQDCDYHFQVAAPGRFSEAFYLNTPRPGGGSQSGSLQNNEDFLANDVKFTVPLRGVDLGGYTIQFLNTILTADSHVDLPSECSDASSTAMPSSTCIAAVASAINAQQCQLPGCINACRSRCSKRRVAM